MRVDLINIHLYNTIGWYLIARRGVVLRSTPVVILFYVRVRVNYLWFVFASANELWGVFKKSNYWTIRGFGENAFRIYRARPPPRRSTISDTSRLHVKAAAEAGFVSIFYAKFDFSIRFLPNEPKIAEHAKTRLTVRFVKSPTTNTARQFYRLSALWARLPTR